MIHYSKSTNHIITLTLDQEGSTENALDFNLIDSFNEVFEFLKKEKSKDEILGIIITSKKDSFLVGTPPNRLNSKQPAQEIYASIEKLNKVLRDLEIPDIPIVAAINGDALNAGFELALACHHRIALNDSILKLGMTELKYGLIPGSGGVIRSMYLIGFKNTYALLSESKTVNPQRAHELGWIHELADSPQKLISQAEKWIQNVQEFHQPWDVLEPNDLRLKPNEIQNYIATLGQSESGSIRTKAKLLDLMVQASRLNFSQALQLESRVFTGLVRSQTYENRIRLYWDDLNKIQEGNHRPKGIARFRPKKICIIGAGQMGRSLAAYCATLGIQILLKDIDLSVAQSAINKIKTDLQSGEEEGIEDIISKLTPIDNYELIDTCDLIIEAVFENIKIKSGVLKEVSKLMDKYALLCSITSSLSITELSKSCLHPEKLIGLQLFSPVDQSEIMEIIRTKHTSDEPLAQAMDFADQINKVPILVEDTPCFFINSIRIAYIFEGLLLLTEGVSAAHIEHAAEFSGNKIGPLAACDDLSIELTKINLPKLFKTPIEVLAVLDKFISNGRTGRFANKGFYNYENGIRKHLSIDPNEKASGLSNEVIKKRLLFSQTQQALKLYDQNTITSIHEINYASVAGIGFSGDYGGFFQFINTMGVDKYLEETKKLAEQFGERFKPIHLLLEMESKSKLF